MKDELLSSVFLIILQIFSPEVGIKIIGFKIESITHLVQEC